MTRKDVCKATGLTVKTLRLYEEKGLITPERQYRNGREYRIYTPQLVEALQKIVLLRKALFTMDEIRTMQRSPDAIPKIFETYRQWLTVQEQTLRLLRQTAQNIDAGSLTSLDGLVTDLQKAARQMPLPKMDHSPDFKHIDAMEELPRHVTPQHSLDDTVPSARVFRQVNLVMDSDRSNNVNVAFGQYNEARRTSPEESGSVLEAFRLPRWQPCGDHTHCVPLPGDVPVDYTIGLIASVQVDGRILYKLEQAQLALQILHSLMQDS